MTTMTLKHQQEEYSPQQYVETLWMDAKGQLIVAQNWEHAGVLKYLALNGVIFEVKKAVASNKHLCRAGFINLFMMNNDDIDALIAANESCPSAVLEKLALRMNENTLQSISKNPSATTSLLCLVMMLTKNEQTLLNVCEHANALPSMLHYKKFMCQHMYKQQS